MSPAAKKRGGASAPKKPARIRTAQTPPAAPDKALVLRSCRPDGQCCLQGHRGSDFRWPKSGPVSCADFKATPTCGNGLHGLLWGEGKGNLLDWTDDAAWLVVEVLATEIVQVTEDGGGKVKFPRGEVVFFGKADDAVAYLQARAPAGKAITKGTATAGYRGTATAGYRGTATAGDRGTATAGYSGTATAGDGGTATAGYSGTATAGYRGTATAGYRGTATAGDSGTATAGDRGTATAGYSGTATAGDRGTATAGYSGTATAGYRGTATAGDRGTAKTGDLGVIAIRWWDRDAASGAGRYRMSIGYVGEDGIKPNTFYKLDDKHKFVKVTP